MTAVRAIIGREDASAGSMLRVRYFASPSPLTSAGCSEQLLASIAKSEVGLDDSMGLVHVTHVLEQGIYQLETHAGQSAWLPAAQACARARMWLSPWVLGCRWGTCV